MQTIDAYFLSYGSPARSDPDPRPYRTLKIKYVDGTWEEIYRAHDIHDKYGITRKLQRDLLRRALEHYTGKPVAQWVVKKLLDRPATGILRLTPEFLDEYLIECYPAQIEMFGRDYARG